MEKKWTGDKGETSLNMNVRVKKNSQRVEAYGTIDELNSVIGLTIAESDDSQIRGFLEEIQRDLMVIGSDLSTLTYDKTKRIDGKCNDELEKLIKFIDKDLAELKNFILPGGTRTASFLHVSRSVCRRAERQIVSLKETEQVNEEILKYLNRLSYVLFLLARLDNKRHARSEKMWTSA